MKKVIVIGSGFAGLSAAACLGASGFDVTVVEKNATPGGRARKFESHGFTFDMGPSWYWMPDVFERFFQNFGKRPGDYYDLHRLDPSYRIFYGPNDFVDVPATASGLSQLFEEIEPGSSPALAQFLSESAFKYNAGMGNIVYKAGLTWRDLTDMKLLTSVRRLNIFQSHASYVRRFFKHPRLISLLEFPVIFLGAASTKIPALYSLMNYADLSLGTWYPMGGMFRVVDAIVKVAEEYGVAFKFNSPVNSITASNDGASGVTVDGNFFGADYVVATADYHHVEQELLDNHSQSYSPNYWQSRTLAPSCLIFFIGLNKRVNNLLHHTLFFDEDMDTHMHNIFEDAAWPAAPLFYVCCPSKTDASVAPPGCENLFVLMPAAPGLSDSEDVRDQYFSLIIKRLENITGERLQESIVCARSYAHNDFSTDYNAFKGNAYGLANTLMQTANLRPSVRSKKIKNLFFAGQLTVPGPGVPPALISGQIAAQTLLSCERKYRHADIGSKVV